MMDDRYVLISGSASHACPADKLDAAVRFVTQFTAEVLKQGGGIVVLAGEEESATNHDGTPLIFDWVVLRAVAQFAERTTAQPRAYARVVMSDQAPESKIGDANLQLLKNLEQRDVVERFHIRHEIFTGGEYRSEMTGRADAMLAVGGGKGTYSAGTLMTQLGKPVLPLDLQLGSTAQDGEGALDLYREMLSDASRFFPNIHPQITNRMAMLSLNRGVVEPEAAALTAAEMLSRELSAIQPDETQPAASKNRLLQVGQVLKELPLVAAAVRVVEFLRGLLPFAQL